MSITSGFNSKMQETSYIKLTESLVELLAEKVFKSLLCQPSDDQTFAKHLVTIYTKMSRIEVQKIMPPKLSNCFHDLSLYLASLYPESRCNSSDSSHTRSDNSQPSPIPFDSLIHTEKKNYMQHPLMLDEIEEEDFKKERVSENKQRFHSQPRRGRDISPTKNAFKNSLSRNYPRNEDMMGKYMKMSEKFSEKKGKKEESLYFSNGIFFHIP